jgi:hypothetical protein
MYCTTPRSSGPPPCAVIAPARRARPPCRALAPVRPPPAPDGRHGSTRAGPSGDGVAGPSATEPAARTTCRRTSPPHPSRVPDRSPPDTVLPVSADQADSRGAWREEAGSLGHPRATCPHPHSDPRWTAVHRKGSLTMMSPRDRRPPSDPWLISLDYRRNRPWWYDADDAVTRWTVAADVEDDDGNRLDHVADIDRQHQLVAFQPGLEPHMRAFGRRPPGSREARLPAIGGESTPRQNRLQRRRSSDAHGPNRSIR